MAVQVKNRVIKNVGKVPVEVTKTDPSKRQTILGLSITNLTDGFLYVSVLLKDDTSVTGFYLKDSLLAAGSSLRAVSTGEKLVLGTNNELQVQASADDAVDVIVSFVETT
tara:strand:+ start:155 stop:484 length:330 start_codon:yes stop_codon:yes gene_type:complete